MGRCATCKFFGTQMGVESWDDDADDMIATGHHACARVIHGNGHRNKKSAANELAVVTDGSGYAARLQVMPAFGCVLHEEKIE